MSTELRKSGISAVGDLPWGAHFCYFYETKQDLLDILIPYFKTGLENKEFCLWVISNSELLTVEEATSALRNALPDLDRYVAERSIEVVGHEEWFLSGNIFDPYKVADTKPAAPTWSAPPLLNTGYSESGPSPPPAMSA